MGRYRAGWAAGRRLSVAICIWGCFGLSPAWGQEDNLLRGSFGQHGTTAAIVMPTGRMAPDGEFGLGYSEISPYRRYFVTQQFLPWLQGTFRYTGISTARYADFAQNQSYKDKSVDVKLRLIKEGPYFPDVSVGVRDLGGTGLFASEYFAATRRIYDFDITTGLAWGNMGARGGINNPFGYLSDSFLTSSRTVSGSTGQFNKGFFSGSQAAPYGAIEWYPSRIPSLSVKLEYDGNDYRTEPFGADLGASSPLNFGLVYRPFSWLDLAASYERGNTVAFRFVLHSNFNTGVGVPHIAEKPPFPVPMPDEPSAAQNPSTPNIPVDAARLATALSDSGIELASSDLTVDRALIRTRSLPSRQALRTAENGLRAMPAMTQFDTISFVGPDGQPLQTLTGLKTVPKTAPDTGTKSAGRGTDKANGIPAPTIPQNILAERVFAALKLIDFTGEVFAVSGSQAYLKFSQNLYRDRNQALVRAARAVAAMVPQQITVLDLVERVDGLPVSHKAFLRRDIALAANYQRSFDEAWMNADSLRVSSPASSWTDNDDAFPDFSWSLAPKLRQSVGGPDNFYLYQIYGSAGASIKLNENWSVEGTVGANIANNFENFNYEAPSNLPRVRTKIKDYLKDAPVWINSLHLDYVDNLTPEIYYRASAGIYEWMYDGIGGEVLYKKPDARWAIGLDANYVWQRDFDGGFGLLDYSTLVGNLTYYHKLPFWNLEAQVSVGRYLAGDVGATVNLIRQFDNGVKFGVWATKTDVSAEQFGEGSFDKGFFVSIPFEVFSTKPSKSTADFAFAPLTRDGGQKVAMPKPLYGIVSEN